MRLHSRAKTIGCALIAAVMWAGSATALDSHIYDNLQRSRDALLTQRNHLQQTADDISRKIDALQRQQDTVNSYLRDTDNALHDVDEALRRAGY